MRKKRNIIVTGGGASGMAAAIAAARCGGEVTILEQKERLGKKILSTGNGKCNYTNEHMEVSCFHGEDTRIVAEVLKRFGMAETLSFFGELGIFPKSRNGYYYPRSEQAAAVSDVLCMELKRLGVSVCCGTKVTGIRKKQKFEVQTSGGVFTADALILAAGGKASPVLGSDGSGYSLAKSLGHSISPVVPALCALHGKGTFFSQVAGVRTEANISLFAEDICMASDTGELQFTGYGISGIPVFQVSRFASLALEKKQKVTAVLDFWPEMPEEEMTALFLERKRQNAGKKMEEFLTGIFNKKLIPVLLRAAGIHGNKRAGEYGAEAFERLSRKCKGFEIEITAANSFEQAQICAGGVRTDEISHETMESCITKGLYLAGELLDVDGICGGYNLQWAWATGVLAGTAAAKGNKYDSY